MPSVHKGDSDEVKRLGDLLIRIIKQLRDTQKDGVNILRKMDGSVNDNVYQEAEGIVQEVAQIILKGLDDTAEVAKKVKAYGEYLESLG